APVEAALPPARVLRRAFAPPCAGSALAVARTALARVRGAGAGGRDRRRRGGGRPSRAAGGDAKDARGPARRGAVRRVPPGARDSPPSSRSRALCNTEVG